MKSDKSYILCIEQNKLPKKYTLKELIIAELIFADLMSEKSLAEFIFADGR